LINQNDQPHGRISEFPGPFPHPLITTLLANMGVPIHMAPSVLLQLRPSDLGDLIALELVIDKPIINQSVNESINQSMNQSNNQSINLSLSLSLSLSQSISISISISI
jgi:hypothetical protein